MSPLEAKSIIEALANGINPETGEVLSTQSTLHNPSIIRALFLAAKALDSAEKRAERSKALPNNAGRPWSEDEDQQLLTLFDTDIPINDIAQKHGRTRGAITSRLVRLGRIQERADAR